ncbi:MAG TPA: hypothetical protein VJ732_02750 [Bryobacteraceae bacterium]|nr:hypothetical protein [Bryobacteraceae bacterium]
MRARRSILVLAICPAFLWGQTPKSVTVSSTQSITAPPDKAVLQVVVSSGTDKALTDVLSAVQGTGISAADLVSITTGLNGIGPSPVGKPPAPMLQWAFQLPAPVSQLKATSAALIALEQSIAKGNTGLSLSFSVSGTQISAAQSSCNLAGLVADARSQAQQRANAAGLSLGSLLGLSSVTSTSVPGPCSLTARFALGVMAAQPDFLTITASRPADIPLDQVRIILNINSDPTLGLDDVTNALAAAGITGTTFSSLNTNSTVTGGTPPQPRQVLDWSFTLYTPLANLKGALAPIVAAQQPIAKNHSGLSLSFGVQGPVAAAAAQPSQSCPVADLLADAQAQAQNVATAAGVSVGPIATISGGNAVPAGIGTSGIFVPAQAQIGIVSAIGVSSFLLGPITPPAACSLTVQFQLIP